MEVQWQFIGSQVAVQCQSVTDEWPLSGITMAVKWLKVGGGVAEN